MLFVQILKFNKNAVLSKSLASISVKSKELEHPKILERWEIFQSNPGLSISSGLASRKTFLIFAGLFFLSGHSHHDGLKF